MKRRIRTCSLVLAIAFTVESGLSSEFFLVDGEEQIELGSGGVSTKDLIALWGEPDEVVLPTVFPIKNAVVTDCVLIFSRKGVIARFVKSVDYEAPVVRDIFLFCEETVFGQIPVARSRSAVFAASNPLDIWLQGSSGVRKQAFDRLFMWQGLSQAMVDKIEKESGLRVPERIRLAPDWDGCPAVAYQVDGASWAFQYLMRESSAEPFALRLRYVGSSAQPELQRTQIETEIEIRKP